MPIQSAHTILTERLSLRPYHEADFEPLYRLWTHNQIREWIFGEEPIPDKRGRQAIEDSRTSFAKWGFGQWSIRRQNEEAVIGFCGLLVAGDAFRDDHLVQADAAELYYGLVPSEWSKGLITEAAKAVLRYGLERCGVIVALVDEENRASRRVIETLGFTFIKTVEDEGELVRYYQISSDAVPPTTG